MTTIVVYSKTNCIYCEQAKSLLTSKGLTYTELDVKNPDTLAELKQLVPGVKTVPQIFIDGKLIGGYTELVPHLA
jgi:glutaredoxin